MTATIHEHDMPGLLCSLRVAKKDAARCVDLFARIRDETGSDARLVSWDIIRRDCRLGTDVHVMLRFVSTRAMMAWKSDPLQLALMPEIEALALTGISQQEALGRKGSFKLITARHEPPAVPPLWKRWTVSMLAVYPALVILVVLLDPITVRFPAPLSLFLVALVLTGLNTAFMLPWLNRLLRNWLSHRDIWARRSGRTRAALPSRPRP